MRTAVMGRLLLFDRARNDSAGARAAAREAAGLPLVLLGSVCRPLFPAGSAGSAG
jgi:hypothetical protein